MGLQSFQGVDAIKSARVHKVVSKSDSVNLTDTFRELFCTGAGTAAIVDELDNVITYTLAVGDTLSFSPKRVNASGSTATLVGWY